MQPLLLVSTLLLGASVALPHVGRSGAAPEHSGEGLSLLPSPDVAPLGPLDESAPEPDSAEAEARGAHRSLKKHLVEIVPLRPAGEALAYIVPDSASAAPGDDVTLPAPALADLLAYLRTRGEPDVGDDRDYHLHYIVHKKRARPDHSEHIHIATAAGGYHHGGDQHAHTDHAVHSSHHPDHAALPEVDDSLLESHQDTRETLHERHSLVLHDGAHDEALDTALLGAPEPSGVSSALRPAVNRQDAEVARHVLDISSDENERSDSLGLDFSKNLSSNESGDSGDTEDSAPKGDSGDSEDGEGSESGSGDSGISALGRGSIGDSQLGNEFDVVSLDSEGSGSEDSGSILSASLESKLLESLEDEAGADDAPEQIGTSVLVGDCKHAHTLAPPCDDACHRHRHYKLTFLFNR